MGSLPCPIGLLAGLPAFAEAPFPPGSAVQYRYGGQDCLARYWTVENKTALVATGTPGCCTEGHRQPTGPCVVLRNP
jgi:hypothetical protein